jgi:hypothetical protein
MAVLVKLNNHADNHQIHGANHSVLELLFNGFASFKTVKPMVLMLNKVSIQTKN